MVKILVEGVYSGQVQVRPSQLLQASLVKNPLIQERVRHLQFFRELVVPKAPHCLEQLPDKPQTLWPVKPRHQQVIFSKRPQAHKLNLQGICSPLWQPRLPRLPKHRVCSLLSQARPLRQLKPLQVAVSYSPARQLTSRQLHKLEFLDKNLLQILSPSPNLHLPQAFFLLLQHLLVEKKPLLRPVSSTQPATKKKKSLQKTKMLLLVVFSLSQPPREPSKLSRLRIRQLQNLIPKRSLSWLSHLST